MTEYYCKFKYEKILCQEISMIICSISDNIYLEDYELRESEPLHSMAVSKKVISLASTTCPHISFLI